MRNLEQERAAHALKTANENREAIVGTEGGAVVKKIPTMIRENGLLAAGAFACEKGKGYEVVFKKMLEYYSGDKIEIKAFLEQLCQKDSAELRHVTAECIEYLKYLRRFV